MGLVTFSLFVRPILSTSFPPQRLFLKTPTKVTRQLADNVDSQLRRQNSVHSPQRFFLEKLTETTRHPTHEVALHLNESFGDSPLTRSCFHNIFAASEKQPSLPSPCQLSRRALYACPRFRICACASPAAQPDRSYLCACALIVSYVRTNYYDVTYKSYYVLSRPHSSVTPL